MKDLLTVFRGALALAFAGQDETAAAPGPHHSLAGSISKPGFAMGALKLGIMTNGVNGALATEISTAYRERDTRVETR